MALSRTLARLLRVRELEEEQRRLSLEAAQSELNRLESALDATRRRELKGRELVTLSARSGQLPDRLAGIEESRTGRRHAAALKPHIAQSEERVAERREEFLEKRVERRQAETLIEEEASRAAAAAGRRTQQALDNWFGSRSYRAALEAERQRAGLEEAVELTEAPIPRHTGRK